MVSKNQSVRLKCVNSSNSCEKSYLVLFQLPLLNFMFQDEPWAKVRNLNYFWPYFNMCAFIGMCVCVCKCVEMRAFPFVMMRKHLDPSAAGGLSSCVSVWGCESCFLTDVARTWLALWQLVALCEVAIVTVCWVLGRPEWYMRVPRTRRGGGIGNEVPGASGLCVCAFFLFCFHLREWVCLFDIYVCLFVYFYK